MDNERYGGYFTREQPFWPTIILFLLYQHTTAEWAKIAIIVWISLMWIVYLTSYRMDQ